MRKGKKKERDQGTEGETSYLDAPIEEEEEMRKGRMGSTHKGKASNFLELIWEEENTNGQKKRKGRKEIEAHGAKLPTLMLS